MSPIVTAGLIAPVALFVLAAAIGLAFGALWAALALAVGFAVFVAIELWFLDALLRWAEGGLDARVPEGRGAWRIAFSAIYRRVRVRTLHQRDLTHTIERFRSAAEAIPDGMVVLDARNRIRWVNVRGRAQFGLELPRDIGSPLMNLVRQPEFVRYFEIGDFTEALLIDSQRSPGTTLSIQVVPFAVDEKLLISRDISGLEAVARMRRDFIANVSHELKTPLTVVSGFLETLEDLKLEPRQQLRYVQLMREQAASMERLVNDLLTLSTLESESNPPMEAPFPIVPLLHELAAAANALSQGSHRIVLEIAQPATVTGGRDEIASAFGNLVSNAVRYTPTGGTITLAFGVDAEGGGEFSVTDTGIGIAPEHIPRLTERFYRVDRSRSRATGGTGLGLAIVKHVLLRHQATLSLISEPGNGSRFAVHLPPRRVAWSVTDDANAVPAPTNS